VCLRITCRRLCFQQQQQQQHKLFIATKDHFQLTYKTLLSLLWFHDTDIIINISIISIISSSSITKAEKAIKLQEETT